MPDWLKPGHALRRGRLPRGLPGSLALLVLFAGAALLAARLDPLPPPVSGAARAADGDSLTLGGERVRLVGLDAHELDQVCWRPDGTEWECGRAARDLMANLVSVNHVTCAPQGVDKFARTLARCAVDGADVGAAMVTAGLAVSRFGYPGEESAARAAQRGIWDGRFTDPRDWRDVGPTDDPAPGLAEQVWTWLRELTGARALR